MHKTTDKTTAQRILADKLADVALRREGIIDTRQEGIVIESGKSLETHLGHFQAMMKARQRSERHIGQTLFLTGSPCRMNTTLPRCCAATWPRPASPGSMK